MCVNSHSMATVGSAFPVASSAFWQRIFGKPIPSSCAIDSALNSGNAGDSSVIKRGFGTRLKTRKGSRYSYLLCLLEAPPL